MLLDDSRSIRIGAPRRKGCNGRLRSCGPEWLFRPLPSLKNWRDPKVSLDPSTLITVGSRPGGRKGQVFWRKEFGWKDFLGRGTQEAAEQVCSRRSSGYFSRFYYELSRHLRYFCAIAIDILSFRSFDDNFAPQHHVYDSEDASNLRTYCCFTTWSTECIFVASRRCTCCIDEPQLVGRTL